jgi:hypothetical protein
MSIRQLWRAWGAVVAILALPILLWGGAGPPKASSRAADDLAAEVPALPVAVDQSAEREELAKTTLWGVAPGDASASASATGAAGAAAAQWSLAGVYMKDDTRRVVLRFAQDSQAPRLVAEGESLPDGTQVAAIERDRVQLRQPGDVRATRWVKVNRTSSAQ